MNKFSSFSTIIFFGFVFLGLNGCRSVTAPSTSTEEWRVPDREKKAQASDPVWASIRERKLDLSEPLTLARIMDIALTNNPSTRQAWWGARAVAAAVKQSESQWYPRLTVSGGGNYQRQKFNLEEGVPPESDASTNEFNYGPNLKITYLLLDLGGRSAAVEEAVQNLLAANYSFNQAIQDLLLGVEQAYYTLHSSDSNLDAVRANVEDAKTALEAARQKFKVGLVSKLDELQAQSNYDNALYSLEQAKGDVKTARADLARVIGLPADTRFKIAAPSGRIPTEIEKDDVSQLIEEALMQRPDIAALRSSLRARQAAVTVANSSLWPNLSAGGTASKSWYNYHGDNELYNDSYAYTGYVTLGWDIFSGLYNLNAKRAAEAKLAEEREKLTQAELEASADVWTKYYGYNTAVGKLTFSQAFFNTSQASYNLALESYKTGLKSILDLLQAQSSLSSARSQLIQSKKDVFVALAELAHATGSLGAINKSY